MKILILGFQRSGTTILRRIINSHPEVKRIMHESFLLTKCQNKPQLKKQLVKHNINIKKDNWGEKVPYYPNIRRTPTVKYCEKWIEYFGEQSRIIHIVRHPYDITLSIMKKYAGQNKFHVPLTIYKRKVINTIPQIMNLDNTLTIKYEQLITHPDITIPMIYEFCGVDSTIDYKHYLQKLKNKKYQSIDSSRAFAYKKKKIKSDIDISEVLQIANTIEGPEYKGDTM